MLWGLWLSPLSQDLFTPRVGGFEKAYFGLANQEPSLLDTACASKKTFPLQYENNIVSGQNIFSDAFSTLPLL